MKLQITNQQLINYTKFMNIVKAKGRKARATAKFIKILQAKFGDYSEDEMSIVMEYSQKDDDGNLLSQTEIIWEDAEAGNKELYELKQEEIVIDLTEFEPHIETLISAIEDNDYELQGNDLLVFDELLDNLEKIGGNE